MAASSPLIAQIYDAALDPTAIESLARALTEYFGGVSAMITDVDSLGEAQAVQWGHDVTLSDAYAAYYRDLDVWVSTAPRCAPGAATSVDRLVSYEDLARTEFYNDFLRKNGEMAHCLGVWAPVDSGVGIVSVQRSRRQGPFDRDDEVRLDRLAPHLARAAQMRARLNQARARVGTLSDLLDRASDAVMVLRADGGLEHMNFAARRLVMDGIVKLTPHRQVDRGGRRNEALIRALQQIRSTPVTPVHFALAAGRYLGAADRIESPQRRRISDSARPRLHY
jgi:hypothetical protein